MNVTVGIDGTSQQVCPSIVSFVLVDVVHKNLWAQAHPPLNNKEKRVIWLNLLHPEFHHYAVF